ncbi:MAG: PH domain-containing protein [Bacteroidales bacterium]|nr:PH domain-containing protein [Bacteroidales bacterium]
MTQKEILLRPTFNYWLVKGIPGLLIIIAIIFVEPLFDKMMGKYTSFILIAVPTIIFLIMTYNYILWTVCTKWIIDDTKIYIHRGLIKKNIDHIELYRVLDIKETQGLLDQIFGIETIWLYSQDVSDPTLRIFGVKRNKKIIDEINERVRSQRRNNKILELTNN